MSVRNFLRRQTDVNHSSSNARTNQNQIASDNRPLSEYDNIKPTASQTHFPLGEIKFRFDDSPFPTTDIIMNNNTSNSSAVHYNNNNDNKQTTTLPAHQYENVLETLQMRNKRESDQQVVKTNQIDEQSPLQKSVMSVAKSSFFGLNDDQQTADDDFDKLIEDIGNSTIVSSDRNQYVNVMPNESPDESKAQSIQDKVSATSSASGSSSTTVTPSSSPTRQERTESSRKNSEGSNRSKSPKFMLPESSPSSPSQVSKSSQQFGD